MEVLPKKCTTACGIEGREIRLQVPFVGMPTNYTRPLQLRVLGDIGWEGDLGWLMCAEGRDYLKKHHPDQMCRRLMVTRTWDNDYDHDVLLGGNVAVRNKEGQPVYRLRP
eukprot:gene933-5256_t